MPDGEFTPGDATDVAHKCTIATTLNNHPLSPNETLADYGVSTSEQITLIKKRIRTDDAFGLPHHGRSIDPNALKDLDLDWRIADLSNLIFDESFESESAFINPSMAKGPAVKLGRSSPSISRPADTIVELTQQYPIQALVISATLGMLLGFVLGTTRR